MGVQSAAAQLMAKGRDNDGIGREVSAGGVVVKDGKVLLVRTKTLRGELVWTFPKGHIEEGESIRETACREVEEETGYRCRIIEAVGTVRYQFMRGGRLIKKRVRWYWMEPGARVGRPDEGEIYALRWAAYAKAEPLLSYPADHDLLKKTQERFPMVFSPPPSRGEGKGQRQ